MEKILTFLFLGISISFASCDKKTPDSTYIPKTGSGDTAAINSSVRFATTLLRKSPLDAIEILDKTLKQSESLNYSEGIGNSYEYAGIAWFYRYNYDSAIYFHNKAYNVFEKINDKNKMALALFSMSYDYSLIHDLQKSLECAERARQLYEESKNFVGVYDCIEGLTYINRQLQNSNAVDSLMKEIIVAAENTGDSKKIANSYYNLGSHYINQAYLNLAIDAFFKSLKIAEKSGDSVEIANALGSIGLANLYLQDYDNAINYYKKQELILLRIHNDYERSITYSNLGESYSSKKDYETSLNYHFKALELRKQMKYDLAVSNSLFYVASTYFQMNKTDSAFKYVTGSTNLNYKIRNYSGLAKNYMLLGKIELAKKNIDKGIKLLEESINFAEKYDDADVLNDVSRILSSLYSSKNEFRKAFQYILIHNQISDSIVSEKNIKRITQLEMQHSFDKKQSEVEVQHLKEKLFYETKLKRDKLILQFSVILGALLLILGSSIYLNYLRSRKSNKEKEYLLKEIHHRVKNNLMVISSLLNLQSGSITDDNTKSAVRESQNRVKSMALIHQLLYQSDRFTNIDFPKYLTQLMESLQSTYNKPGKKITINIKAEDIRLDIDTAIPLGLITNEVATNAYKYAFNDSTAGEIKILFHHLSDHSCELRISDNGIGLPKNFNPDETSTLGLKLVRLLSKQIKAKFSFTSDNGADFRIIFNEQVM